MLGSSNSVRVQFSADQCPQSFAAAHALLGVYGDIARLDVTLVSAAGFVLATYFDVRAADRVLADFGAHAETFPAEKHDFRAVTVSSGTMMALSGTFRGFEFFGEVMGMAPEGQDMTIEYFDMRAAHAVLLSLPTSKPRYQAGGLREEAALPFHMLHQAADTFSNNPISLSGGSSPFDRGLTPEDESPSGSLSGGMSAFGGAAEQCAWEPAAVAGGMPVATSVAVDRAGKPARAKAGAKDLAKFEIQADRIASGEDTRTTVMMRNIPKACSREDVEQLLARCGLADRYTFFYMPFDKRRSVLCGFAFLNLRSPTDVLQLHASAQTSLWRTLASGTSSMPPAVSYARLQGHQELVKHFSLSAITYDKDIRKRPAFMQGSDVHADAKPNVNVDHCSMQPRYVSVGSVGSVRPVRVGYGDMDWLQSSAVGA